jgi:hypothetical protein
MKKMIVLVVLLVLTFALVTPAAAGGFGPGGGRNGAGTGTDVGTVTGAGVGQGQQAARGTFALTGTIAAIGTDTVTIDVYRGNKLVQPYLGTQVTVTVTSATRFLLRDGTTVSIISLADLEVGQQVSVNGLFVDDVWMISRITVGATLSCLQ